MAVLSLNSNIASLLAQRRLAQGDTAATRSYERLSSGQRINRASDDAAGLSVASSLNLNKRIAGQAIRNLNDGISYLNIADGAIGELSNVVIRLTELATQSASGSYSRIQRLATRNEADELVKEFNRLIQSTSFNGQKQFEGGISNLSLQAGRGINAILSQQLGEQMSRNVGSGFTRTAVVNSGLGDIGASATGDLDNDGDLDLVVLDLPSDKFFVYKNNGGVLGEREQFSASGATAFTLADENGDGILDLLHGKDVEVFVFQGATEAFNYVYSYSTGSVGAVTALQVIDFDRDGSLDIITGHDNGEIRVTTGISGGTVIDKISLDSTLSSSVHNDIQVIDFNSDGRLDIIASSDSDLVILNGDSSGLVTLAQLMSNSNGDYRHFEIADLNRDGLLDIATLQSATIHEYLGQTSGGVSTQAARVLNAASLSDLLNFEMGDFNGDNILDYVMTYRGDAEIVYLDQNRSIQRRITALASASASPYDFISTGDFNNDGVLDFATVDSSGISMGLGNAVRSSEIGFLDLYSQDGARVALETLAQISRRISGERGKIGAFQSRLESALGVLRVSKENFGLAESRIKDADIADESATLVRSQIIRDVASLILAQANQQPQLALSLLK